MSPLVAAAPISGVSHISTAASSHLVRSPFKDHVSHAVPAPINNTPSKPGSFELSIENPNTANDHDMSVKKTGP